MKKRQFTDKELLIASLKRTVVGERLLQALGVPETPETRQERGEAVRALLHDPSLLK